MERSCRRCLRQNVTGLKTVKKKLIILAQSTNYEVHGRPRRTNIYFSRRFYLLILLTEVRDYVCTSISLPL